MTPVLPGPRYRLGRYVVDLVNRQVLLDGVPLDLPWRCFEALRLLLEAQGGVVDREAFFRTLWPGVEVEETSLSKVITQLRRVLATGDPALTYVETVPRLGYRLAVSAVDGQTTEAADSTNGEPVARNSGAGTARPRRTLIWIAAATVLVLGAGAAILMFTRHGPIAEAEKFYEEGRRLRRQADPASMRGAVEAYRRATELNPRHASYFSSLAEALGFIALPGALGGTASLDAAKRAVELDPGCADCRAVLGFALFTRSWEWEQAELHLQEALRLEPKGAGRRGYLAMYLSTQGRLQEALQHIEEGLRQQPYFATGHYIRSQVLQFLRRYDESLAAAQRSLSIDPQNRSAWDASANAFLHLGREKEALAAWREFAWSDQAAELDALYAAQGLAGALRRLLDLTSEGTVRQNNSYRRARWKMYLNDRQGALDELEIAFPFRHLNLMYVAVDPVFDPIRAEPRFRKIVEDMRLPQARATAHKR